MDDIRVGAVDVDHDVIGDGDHVVLLHARPFVDWYDPLVSRLGDVAVVRTRRVVDPERASSAPPFGIADDADAIEHLLGGIGVRRPHLVGHSYGGLLALELARRGNIDIRSIALLEPAGRGFVAPEQAVPSIAPLLDVARNDGATAAMHRFLAMVCGPGYAEQLDAAIPSGVELACRHAEQFFGIELPAVAAWDFDGDDAARIGVPVLLVVGTASGTGFIEAIELLQSWFADAARVDVPDASHLLIADHPDAVADALATFWAVT